MVYRGSESLALASILSHLDIKIIIWSTLLYAIACQEERKAIFQVLPEISAERREGSRTADALLPLIQIYHRTPEANWSALLYATRCQERRKAIVQVLL